MFRKSWRGLKRLAYTMRDGLWFLPALILLASVALAYGVLRLDLRFDAVLGRDYPSVFGVSASGAYSIFSVTAESMMTVAGVTFSITVVALSLAANQYSPRTLRNYMRDRGNQFVLGVFLGSFAYSVIMLRVIHGGHTAFVPSIAVIVGILLAIFSVGVFIYFIHHAAVSLIASHIVETVANDTAGSFEKLFRGEDDQPLERLLEPDGDGLPEHWRDVPALTNGYLQEIDLRELARFAARCGRVVASVHAVGTFVTRSAPLLRLSGTDPIDDRRIRELNGMVVIKNYRTTRQDPGFGVRQIVDIALKALSPSINDTTTALTCLDYLGAVLRQFAGTPDPGNLLYEGGRLRLITRETRFSAVLKQGFYPIIRNAAGNPEVLASALNAIEQIFEQVEGDDRVRVLRDLVARIAASAESGDELDRPWIAGKARAILNLV